jgi:uncharacterized membrane protein
MPADPNDINGMIDEWERLTRQGERHPKLAAQRISDEYRRANNRRINLAILAVCLSLIGWLTFVTAPVGVILGFVAQRNRGVKSTTSDRIASWAIFLGTVPIGIALTVLVEHFAIRHH